jgi:DNA end-binding protein Ku
MGLRLVRSRRLRQHQLRFPYELRTRKTIFPTFPTKYKDMLELASHIVKTKSGHFKPQEFEDHYEEALKELLKKKQAEEKIEAPRERAPAKVINLMDALRAAPWKPRAADNARSRPRVAQRALARRGRPRDRARASGRKTARNYRHGSAQAQSGGAASRQTEVNSLLQITKEPRHGGGAQ